MNSRLEQLEHENKRLLEFLIQEKQNSMNLLIELQTLQTKYHQLEFELERHRSILQNVLLQLKPLETTPSLVDRQIKKSHISIGSNIPLIFKPNSLNQSNQSNQSLLNQSNQSNQLNQSNQSNQLNQSNQSNQSLLNQSNQSNQSLNLEKLMLPFAKESQNQQLREHLLFSIQSDPVEDALANLIQKQPEIVDFLPFHILRVEAGIYEFGKQKVKLMVENNELFVEYKNEKIKFEEFIHRLE